jgi:hypothetical protein
MFHCSGPASIIEFDVFVIEEALCVLQHNGPLLQQQLPDEQPSELRHRTIVPADDCSHGAIAWMTITQIDHPDDVAESSIHFGLFPLVQNA